MNEKYGALKMKDQRLTIVNLPKTRKQIEINNRLTNRLARGWKNILNEFFQPEVKFSQRESILLACLGLAILVLAFTVLALNPAPFGD